MNICKKTFRKLLPLVGVEYFGKRIIVIAVMIIITSFFAALAQSTRNKTALNSGNKANGGTRKIDAQQSNNIARQATVPVADHHTDVWS